MNDLLDIPGCAPLCLSKHEADLYEGLLINQLAHGPETNQIAVMRELRELRAHMAPETHLDVARYTAPRYVPGWVPDP